MELEAKRHPHDVMRSRTSLAVCLDGDTGKCEHTKSAQTTNTADAPTHTDRICWTSELGSGVD